MTPESRAAAMCAALDPAARAAQLVMTGAPRSSTSTLHTGGVIFLGNHRTDALRDQVAQLASRATIPPFFAADIEGGAFQRLPWEPRLRGLPTARALGALPPEQAESWGATVGTVMRDVGLNVNFAPVLDVAPSGLMHVAARSYGGDAERVVSRGRAFARGLRSAGVLAVGKHYPGYGALSGNTDDAIVHATWTAAQTEAHASVFERAAPDLTGLMLASVVYSGRDGLPASFDARIVGEARALVGLVVTDDLSVPALARAVGGDPAEVVRRALLAGNDILLSTLPPDLERGGVDHVEIVRAHAASDPAAAAAVDAACARVLRAKMRAGLLP